MADSNLEITKQFIDAIENGMLKGKWERPWQVINGMPIRHNNKPFDGLNALILMMMGGGQWATMKQWASMGGKLVNAKGQGVKVYRPLYTAKDDEGKMFLYGFAPYTVFHQSLVDGIEFNTSVIKSNIERDAAAELIVINSGVDVRYGHDRAYYVPSADYIAMPDISTFNDAEGYYGTLMHELAHSTGHKSRLDRRSRLSAKYNEQAYAFEELVAELASSFACAELGIAQGFMENHAKYLNGWISILKNDTKAIMAAAGYASKAWAWLKKGAIDNNNVDNNNIVDNVAA